MWSMNHYTVCRDVVSLGHTELTIFLTRFRSFNIALHFQRKLHDCGNEEDMPLFWNVALCVMISYVLPICPFLYFSAAINLFSFTHTPTPSTSCMGLQRFAAIRCEML